MEDRNSIADRLITDAAFGLLAFGAYGANFRHRPNTKVSLEATGYFPPLVGAGFWSVGN